MNKILLETLNLKKSFEHINGSITSFDDLNIKIREVNGLIGPSGSEIIFASFISLTR